jgi:hypothetical protein
MRLEDRVRCSLDWEPFIFTYIPSLETLLHIKLGRVGRNGLAAK